MASQAEASKTSEAAGIPTDTNTSDINPQGNMNLSLVPVDNKFRKATQDVSWITYRVIATAALGGFLYGFSANSLTGTLAQTSFIAQFLTTPDANQRTDGLLGCFPAGCMVGSLVQAPLSKHFGRRICNAIGAGIVAVTGALQAGSIHFSMLLTFRTIGGIGSGMVLANSPVYMSEIAPPQARGLLVGMQGVGLVSAYILSAVCNLGFRFVETAYQWRLIFITLAVVAVLHLASLYFLPESPRWLMEQGQENEAREVLVELHRTKSDPGALFSHAEASQIKAQVEAERLLPSGFLYIFSNKPLLKRAYCSILIWVMVQGTGSTTIANLIPVLMGGLGFGPTLQLALGLIWTVGCVIGCCFNVILIDRVGRVKLLVVGGFGCAAIISVMAVLQKEYLGGDNTAGLNAAVAIYFIFGAFFTCTLEGTAFVYGSEIWPTHLRSEGSTLAYASFFGNAIAYTAPATLGLENLGWKFYMIFVAVTVVSSFAIWFTFPETMGISLEGINSKFGEKVEMDLETAMVAEARH